MSGRTRLLETRAVLPEQEGQIEISVTNSHYSSPSANCCLLSSSSGNDVQLINPYQASAKATKQLWLVQRGALEAAHQYINAPVSLANIQEDMKALPSFPGLINNSFSAGIRETIGILIACP